MSQYIDSNLAKWMFMLPFMVMLLMIQLANAQGITEHYYAFLATAKEGQRIDLAPEVKWNDLLNKLPAGYYYLHLVHSDKKHRTKQQSQALRGWYTTTIKLVVVDAWGKNKLGEDVKTGVSVKSVVTLANPPIDIRESVAEDFKVLTSGMPPKWYTIPSVLRKLVVSNPPNGLFTGQLGANKLQLHRLHTLTKESLNRDTLLDLWRLWQPRLDDYNPKNNITKNLTKLEASLDEALTSNKGFHYLNTVSVTPSVEQNDFLQFFKKFVSELKEGYATFIEEEKNKADKLFRATQKSIKDAQEKYKEAEKAYTDVLNKDNKHKSLSTIKQHLGEAKKLLDKARAKSPESLKVYRDDKFVESQKLFSKVKQYSDTAKDEAEKLLNITKSIIDDSPMEFNFLKGVILLLLLITLAILVYIAMPFLSKLFKRGDGTNHSKDTGIKENIEEDEKKAEIKRRMETDRKRNQSSINRAKLSINNTESLSMDRSTTTSIADKKDYQSLPPIKNPNHKTDDEILLFDALKRSTIIRKKHMEKEFGKVINNDFSLAKSLQGWMKSNMPPALYREIHSTLKQYKGGIIGLYLPEIGEVFNSEDHDLQSVQGTEIYGEGHISKVIRPGVRLIEDYKVSTISRAQVEIRTDRKPIPQKIENPSGETEPKQQTIESNPLLDALDKKVESANERANTAQIKAQTLPQPQQLQELDTTTQKQMSSLESNMDRHLKAYKNDLFKQLDESLSGIVLQKDLDSQKQAHQEELNATKKLTDNLSQEIKALKQLLQETNQRIPTLGAVQLEIVRIVLEKDESFDSKYWVQWLTGVSNPEDLLKRLLNDPDTDLSSSTWHELDQWLQGNTNEQWSLNIPEPKDRYTKALHHRVGIQKNQKVPGLIAFCEKPGLLQNEDIMIKAKVKITTT